MANYYTGVYINTQHAFLAHKLSFLEVCSIKIKSGRSYSTFIIRTIRNGDPMQDVCNQQMILLCP